MVQLGQEARMLMPNHLMIVDDEEAFGEFVAEAAKDIGYETKVTTSGKEFRRQFELFHPSVCVVDMIMPGEDGIQVLEWLAKRQISPRVIVVSGFNPYYLRLANLLATSRGLQVSATLKKPVSLSLLRAALGSPRAPMKHDAPTMPDSLD
jgi:DNA-binding response OmpR family regulator